MRLCIFTNHFFPEDFKVNDIAFELARREYDVTVITAVPDYPRGRFFEGYSLFRRRREVVDGVRVIRLPIIPRGRGGALRLALNYLSYFASASVFTFLHAFKERYDAVFVHLTSPFFIGVPAVHLKRRQGIPLYFWTLDLWPESLASAGGISNPWIIMPQNRMVSYVYRHCDRILIGSKGFARSICGKGDFKSKLVYFPNWAETTDCPDGKDMLSPIPPFDSMVGGDFICLFAGNIGEAQGLDAILLAAERLREKKNIKFVFVGDGRRRENLLSLVDERSLHETVFLPGRLPLDMMPLLMRRASVLMVSLKDDPCLSLTVPAKMQFYMAQGRPILAMLDGDGADLVCEAQCGIAVAAGDIGRFVEAVLQMEAMPRGELEAWGANGRRYYDRYFSRPLRMDQLDALLRTGCTDAPPNSCGSEFPSPQHQ